MQHYCMITYTEDKGSLINSSITENSGMGQRSCGLYFRMWQLANVIGMLFDCFSKCIVSVHWCASYC